MKPISHRNLLEYAVIQMVFHISRNSVAGIYCYSCDAAHFNHECNSTENIRQCPITYDTCITLVRYSSEVGKLQISKRCSKSDSCRVQNFSLWDHAPCDATKGDEWVCVDCCTTDLCNINSAKTLQTYLHSTFTTLMVSLLLLSI